MLLRNIYTKQGLVNGALGRVEHIQFSNISDSKGMKYPAKIYILFDNSSIGCILQDPMYHNAIPIEQCDQEYFYKGRSVIRRQFPLTLAWAISIHKSQGATLNSIYCDIGTNIFEHGMAYVALSRVKTLDGLHLYAFSPNKVTANPKVLEFYSQLIHSTRKQ